MAIQIIKLFVHWAFQAINMILVEDFSLSFAELYEYWLLINMLVY